MLKQKRWMEGQKASWLVLTTRPGHTTEDENKPIESALGGSFFFFFSPKLGSGKDAVRQRKLNLELSLSKMVEKSKRMDWGLFTVILFCCLWCWCLLLKLPGNRWASWKKISSWKWCQIDGLSVVILRKEFTIRRTCYHWRPEETREDFLTFNSLLGDMSWPGLVNH